MGMSLWRLWLMPLFGNHVRAFLAVMVIYSDGLVAWTSLMLTVPQGYTISPYLAEFRPPMTVPQPVSVVNWL